MVRPLLYSVILQFFMVAGASACSDYIAYEEGSSAILLTSPHGAEKGKKLPGVPLRKGGGYKRFVIRADQYTDLLTWRIAALLKEKNLSPFVVVAGIHRSQIDFNRPASEAYESKQAEKCYQYYHQQIRRSIKIIKQKWVNGFMLDIHGQSKYDYDIVRGTRNGNTIQSLVGRFKKDVTEEEEGFFTLLRHNGYRLIPKKNNKEKYFYGGYTVHQYGSHRSSGIDAVQIEVGRGIRNNTESREKMASDIANAISYFYKRYYQRDFN